VIREYKGWDTGYVDWAELPTGDDEQAALDVIALINSGLVEIKMMKRQINKLNEAAKIRLAAIEKYQAGGVTLQDLADKFGVHKTTIREWILMYEEGGIERLKTYMKPRASYDLDEAELSALLEADPNDETIASLLDLATGMGLNEAAKKWGITPQGLAKRRRQYVAGKI